MKRVWLILLVKINGEIIHCINPIDEGSDENPGDSIFECSIEFDEDGSRWINEPWSKNLLFFGNNEQLEVATDVIIHSYAEDGFIPSVEAYKGNPVKKTIKDGNGNDIEVVVEADDQSIADEVNDVLYRMFPGLSADLAHHAAQGVADAAPAEVAGGPDATNGEPSL